LGVIIQDIGHSQWLQLHSQRDREAPGYVYNILIQRLLQN